MDLPEQRKSDALKLTIILNIKQKLENLNLILQKF